MLAIALGRASSAATQGRDLLRNCRERPGPRERAEALLTVRSLARVLQKARGLWGLRRCGEAQERCCFLGLCP